MKRLIAALAIFAAVSVESTNPGLRVTFNIGLFPGRDFFFDVPRHVDDAYAKEWSQVEGPATHMPTLLTYCDSSLVLCAMYDPATRFIGGVQVALALNEFSGATLDWTVQGFIPWTPPVADGAETITYMTKQLYFISEATLSKSTEERMRVAFADEVLQESSVWPVGFNQQLMEVPTDVDGILEAGFTKQSCIYWMGQHYYYNMSSTTPCTADSLLNWFPLTLDDKLIGMGFLAVGALPEKTGERFYFEKPSRLEVQVIVPAGPQCLYQLAEDPTVTTMHIYFIDEPWLVFC